MTLFFYLSQQSDTSLEELSTSASNIILSLRADQASFDARYQFQVSRMFKVDFFVKI